ncbi:MAG: hypothetical protein ACKOYC_04880 [Bacteroidota bacterium]
MIISAFKESHPASYILASIGLVGAGLLWGTGGVIRMEAQEMPLYQGIATAISLLPAWTVQLTILCIIGSQAFHWNKIIADYEVLHKKSLLPLLMFVVYAVAIPDFFSINPALLVTSIILILSEKLFSLYKNPNPLRIVFETAFWSAVATLVWFPAITLFLFVLIAWIILKNVSGRDLLVGFIGFLLPFYMAFVVLFWNDHINPMGVLLPVLDSKKIFYPIVFDSNQEWGFIAVYGLFMCFSAWRINKNFYKNATRVRLFQQTIYLLLIFIPAALFISRGSASYSLYPLVIPVGLLLSYFFLLGKKTWWGELLFLILLVTTSVLASGGLH